MNNKINNDLNNDLNNDFNNDLNNDFNNLEEPIKKYSIFNYLNIFSIFFFIILIFIGIIIYYKDIIIKWYNDNYVKDNEVKQIRKTIKKKKKKIKEIEKKNMKKYNEKKNIYEKSLDNINNKILYNKGSISKYDGYCYLGYDDGQRECVKIDKGSVCLSGKIFPSEDICMIPKLRA